MPYNRNDGHFPNSTKNVLLSVKSKYNEHLGRSLNQFIDQSWLTHLHECVCRLRVICQICYRRLLLTITYFPIYRNSHKINIKTEESAITCPIVNNINAVKLFLTEIHHCMWVSNAAGGLWEYHNVSNRIQIPKLRCYLVT